MSLVLPCPKCGTNLDLDEVKKLAGAGPFSCAQCGLQFTNPEAFQSESIAYMRQVGVREPAKSPKQPSTTFIQLGSAILFVIGFGLTLLGCSGDLNDQTADVLQYSTGLILIAFSLVLDALARILRGK